MPKAPPIATNVIVRQEFMYNVLSTITPIDVQTELFMKPIPRAVGMIKCTIIRDTSGLNKFFPKYILKLSDGNKDMIIADKIANSATPHYKIVLEKKAEENTKKIVEHRLGSLRANFGSTQFYLFGPGYNPKEAKEAHVKQDMIRRQFGTVLYSEKDSLGEKLPRNMKVYIPPVDPAGQSVNSWEDLTEKKKARIDEEFQSQKQAWLKDSSFPCDILSFKTTNDFKVLDFGGRVSHLSKKNF